MNRDARTPDLERALDAHRAATWRTLAPHLSARLSGLRVLELSAPPATCALELARRGARVVAVERDAARAVELRTRARERGLQAHLDVMHADVYELAHARARFDLVLCLGLFEHVRYPLLALDIAARRCRGELVFRATEAPAVEVGPADNVARLGPRLAHRPPARLTLTRPLDAHGRPTGGWCPERRATEAMLRDAGLRVRCCLPGDTWMCVHDAALGHQARTDAAGLSAAAAAAFHAHRPPHTH